MKKMGPPGPREAIEAAIASTGCVVRPDPERGGFVAVDCPSQQARAELVDVMAWEDALYDGRIRQLALAIADVAAERRHRAGPVSGPELASEVQLQVASRVRFIGEAGDQIQDAWTTWAIRWGDCDCQTRLVLALLRSVGIEVQSVGFRRDDGTVAHICAALPSRTGPWYLETTLGPAVMIGEHPYEAARRLGVTARDDLR